MHSASPLGASFVAWNETGVGATGDEAPVERDDDMLSIMPNDLICRTAGYVTLTPALWEVGEGDLVASYPLRFGPAEGVSCVNSEQSFD